MSPPARRRYQLRKPELNDQIEALLDAARRESTEDPDLEFTGGAASENFPSLDRF